MVCVSSCQNIQKYHIVRLRDRLIQVKYNKISQLGILNVDRARLRNRGQIYGNKGTAFWEFDKCPFNRG